MPNFKANAYLVHNGKVVQTGDDLELTEEQAERLGDKVTRIEDQKPAAVEEKPKANLKNKK
jgi:hypothetical protein